MNGGIVAFVADSHLSKSFTLIVENLPENAKMPRFFPHLGPDSRNLSRF